MTDMRNIIRNVLSGACVPVAILVLPMALQPLHLGVGPLGMVLISTAIGFAVGMAIWWWLKPVLDHRAPRQNQG